MSNIRVVTPELIEKAKELKSEGLNRQQIALELHVSYSKISKIFGTERLGIDVSKRVPWNIETLKLLQENYKKVVFPRGRRVRSRAMSRTARATSRALRR